MSTTNRVIAEKENAIYDDYRAKLEKKDYSGAYLVDHANQQIERLLMSDPENKILHQRGMQLALMMSDLSLAIAHLRQSLRIEFSAEEDEFLGELVLQRGLLDIQLGGRHLSGGGLRMRGDISNFSQRYYEALAYLLGDRKVEALQAIDDMLQAKPTNIEAYILKGSGGWAAKTLWSMEDTVEANSCMWQAYLIDPKHPEVFEFIRKIEPEIKLDLEKASEMILKEKFDQALAYLKKGSDKSKNDFEVNIMRCYVLRMQKKFKDSISELESMQSYLSKLHPEALSAEEMKKRKDRIAESFALLYNDMAAFLFEQKGYKDASTLFLEAKKFKIDDPGILCNIGDCALVGFSHEKLNELNQAQEWYDKASQVAAQKGKVDEDIARQLFSRQANLHYERAKKCFNLQKYRECLDFLSKALELHITKDKLYLKANALIQLKMPDKAADVYREILKRDPQDYVACEFMSQFGFKA